MMGMDLLSGKAVLMSFTVSDYIHFHNHVDMHFI